MLTTKTIPFELPEPRVKAIDQTGMDHMTVFNGPRGLLREGD